MIVCEILRVKLGRLKVFFRIVRVRVDFGGKISVINKNLEPIFSFHDIVSAFFVYSKANNCLLRAREGEVLVFIGWHLWCFIFSFVVFALGRKRES